MAKRTPKPSASRLALEQLMRETMALLRPPKPRRSAPKPAKRVGATPRR